MQSRIWDGFVAGRKGGGGEWRALWLHGRRSRSLKRKKQRVALEFALQPLLTNDRIQSVPDVLSMAQWVQVIFKHYKSQISCLV